MANKDIFLPPIQSVPTARQGESACSMPTCPVTETHEDSDLERPIQTSPQPSVFRAQVSTGPPVLERVGEGDVQGLQRLLADDLELSLCKPSRGLGEGGGRDER